MSRNLSNPATPASATRNRHSFLPDSFTNQKCPSPLVLTSPWTSLDLSLQLNGMANGVTASLSSRTVSMDGLRHGQQQRTLLEKTLQTSFSSLYSPTLGSRNPSFVTMMDASFQNSGKPSYNNSRSIWACQQPFTLKLT